MLNKKLLMKIGCLLIVGIIALGAVFCGKDKAKAAEHVDKTAETDAKIEVQIEEILSQMTLRDKICQMLFPSPEAISKVTPVTKADQTMQEAVKTYPVGGIIYSKQNLVSTKQTKNMIAGTQKASKITLFIAADEEGGTVNRLMKKLGTTYIGSMYDYKDQGIETAYSNAKTIATDMSAFGFNLDFAPVADVWSNASNTVIGKRAYSDDYAQAATLVSAAVNGFHDGGVLCTLKHFPGHGDTAEDTHESFAYVTKTKEEIYAQELQPFATGIAAGADFVMMGHLIVGSMDADNPASLSASVIQNTLRKDLGFEGLVITDAMQMGALADNYTVEEVAVKAVQAGNDMLLEPVDIDRTIVALTDAVAQGIITEERIEESVRRILKVKMEYGLISY